MKNQVAPSNATSIDGIDGVGSGNKNLSIITKSKNLAKFKKLKIAKNNFETDFYIPQAKKAFIYLQKAFSKAPIICYFDLKSHC